MSNTLRNIALQTTVPVLCGLIALNAYVVFRNLKIIQHNAAHRVESSQIKADIGGLLVDLDDMETGQRGYLLTGDASYLQPYQDASGRVAADFAGLRSRLTGTDRELEARLESLTESKLAEMKETIRLRDAGYRHRAFLIVGSNAGKQFMDEARATLAALSSAQISNVARYDRELSESIARALQEAIIASGLLLAVTVVAFLALNGYRKRLEVGHARLQQELHATRSQLEQVTSTIFRDFRTLLEQMRGYANMLLGAYGGFLPRQGHEKAERIEDGAGQMIRVLDDLSRNSGSQKSGKVVDLQRMSA